ncbi:hypothetical protein GCM10007269_01080 [Microbacterium murale]|uniref:Uncharacterized protein n=1 Tax=Microbacterium murale TaxID=1081040 RepID=A0ABQ1R9W7_9MICO|nr:hypothetical protein GCM10007269_01080 [Microbacterium murale]
MQAWALAGLILDVEVRHVCAVFGADEPARAAGAYADGACGDYPF